MGFGVKTREICAEGRFVSRQTREISMRRKESAENSGGGGAKDCLVGFTTLCFGRGVCDRGVVVGEGKVVLCEVVVGGVVAEGLV